MSRPDIGIVHAEGVVIIGGSTINNDTNDSNSTSSINDPCNITVRVVNLTYARRVMSTDLTLFFSFLQRAYSNAILIST